MITDYRSTSGTDTVHLELYLQAGAKDETQIVHVVNTCSHDVMLLHHVVSHHANWVFYHVLSVLMLIGKSVYSVLLSMRWSR